MKAAVLEAFHQAPVVQNVPDPICPANGVVVEVKACGVCRSDHHAWVGVDPDVALPHVMGHEFAGVIQEVGAHVEKFKVGDRVTAPFILGCGTCPECQNGEATICDHQAVIGFTGWGAFAEAIAIDNADFNLVHLPADLGFAEAAGMGCRVTTAYGALVDRAGLVAGETLAVHGCGGVGLSAIMIASAVGAEVVAIDVNDAALEMAQKFGASHIIRADQVAQVGEAVRDVTRGGAHVSMDALGVRATFENSIRSLRKKGRHVQVGMPVGAHEVVELPLLELVYSRQISIIGSRGIAAHRFQGMMGLIGKGHFEPKALIRREIGLSSVGAALADMDGFSGWGVTVVTNMRS